MSNTNYIQAASILMSKGDTVTLTNEDRVTLLTIISELESKLNSARRSAKNAQNFINSILEEQ